MNPGDSGCVEDLQCEAVWPGSKCARGGVCECPEHTVPSKTRDGTVCVSVGRAIVAVVVNLGERICSTLVCTPRAKQSRTSQPGNSSR